MYGVAALEKAVRAVTGLRALELSLSDRGGSGVAKCSTLPAVSDGAKLDMSASRVEDESSLPACARISAVISGRSSPMPSNSWANTDMRLLNSVSGQGRPENRTFSYMARNSCPTEGGLIRPRYESCVRYSRRPIVFWRRSVSMTTWSTSGASFSLKIQARRWDPAAQD